MRFRALLLTALLCMMNLTACSTTILTPAVAPTTTPTSIVLPTSEPAPIAPPIISPLLRLGKGVILATALSADGTKFAVSSSGGIYLYDVKDMSKAKFFDTNQTAITQLAFSSKGQFLAGASQGKQASVMLWDTDTGQLLHVFGGITQETRSLVFSPDEQRLAAGGIDGTVQLWDITSGESLTTFNTGTFVLTLAYSPDRSKLVVGGESTGKTLQIWDARTYQMLYAADTTGIISHLVFSSDGQELAVGGGYGQRCGLIQVWLVNSGQLLRDFGKCVEPAFQIAFSRDNKTIATRIDADTLLIWDIASGQLSEWTHLDQNTSREYKIGIEPDWNTFAKAFTGQVTSIGLTPDGSKLVAGYGDNTIGIWDVNGSQLLLSIEARARITYVALNSSGNLLASGDEDGRVQLWNVETGQLLHTFEEPLPVASAIMSSTHGVAFSPDGHLLAAAQKYIICRPDSSAPNSCNGITGWTGVYVWDIVTNRLVNTLDANKHLIRTITFGPHGDVLAAGLAEGAGVRLWDVEPGKPLSSMLNIPGYAVISVAFDPTERTLATGGDDKKIRLWDVHSGRLLSTLEGHAGVVAGLAFSRGGKVLVSGAQDGIRVWDSGSGQLLAATSKGNLQDITSVAVSVNGELVAAGSNDGIVQLWRISWP